MVRIVLHDELTCVSTSNSNLYYKSEVETSKIRACCLLNGKHFRIYSNILDLPLVSQADICIINSRDNTNLSSPIKIKHTFNRENSRIVSCPAFIVKRNDYGDRDLVQKLRARCLI